MRKTAIVVASVLLASCAGTDIDFGKFVRVVARVTDQRGLAVANAQVLVTSFVSPCRTGTTTGLNSVGQATTDADGRYRASFGLTGQQFEGCVDVAASPSVRDTFPRVSARRDSIVIRNISADSVLVNVVVARP